MYGLDTIRKFGNNTSDMKKLAAWDFEDLLQVSSGDDNTRLSLYNPFLQCIIPVIEGLLPKRLERHILDLFLLATWHAYAKLWLHTDNTLDSFDKLTQPLGASIRHFSGKLSDSFPVKELPKEATAQQRRTAANLKKKPVGGSSKLNKLRQGAREIGVCLNLCTYKFHALGDYVATICRWGTTDSYNTQIISHPFTF